MTTAQVEENSKKLISQTQLQKKSYFVEIESLKIIVHPNVFPTATDTKLLARNVKVYKNHTVLDVTTGCGIIALITGLQGAHVTASDINPLAIKNAKENFKKHHVSVETYVSNIFSNIPKKKFDFIFTNPPYHEGKPKTLLEHAWFGGSLFLEKFFSESKNYLSEQGKIVMVFPEWENFLLLEQLINKNKFVFHIPDKLTSPDGQRIYRLYEISHSQQGSL